MVRGKGRGQANGVVIRGVVTRKGRGYWEGGVVWVCGRGQGQRGVVGGWWAWFDGVNGRGQRESGRGCWERGVVGGWWAWFEGVSGRGQRERGRGQMGRGRGQTAPIAPHGPHSLHGLPHIAAPQAVAEVLGRLLHAAPQRQWGQGRLRGGGLSPTR